jgi:trans-aconitate 2-methyltransferase
VTDAREWNASVYHRVSAPQTEWGATVLDRLPLRGDETVLDVGCGTGRLAALIVERLPRGRLVAVDRSANMLRLAAQHLDAGSRVTFVQAEATMLPFAGAADAIFSTATFHWVLDHDALFASLFAALRPGGRLVAQCGGARNLERFHARCLTVMREPAFAPYFVNWVHPWEFADAETSRRRLERAGFVDVQASVHPSPVLHPDSQTFSEFVEHVVCRPHLQHLPDPALRARFMRRVTDDAAAASPPFELDYWRLNLDGRRPGTHTDVGSSGRDSSRSSSEISRLPC